MKIFKFKNKKDLFTKSKISILKNCNFSISKFIKNITYLFKYDIKNMYSDPNINIGMVTELAAIKTKFIWDDIKVPKIKNDMDTILELVNTDKSIIRFGDGEINLMLDKDNCFEKRNENFKFTFRKIFYNNDPNLLTGTRFDMFRMNTNFTQSNISTYRFQYLLKNYEKIKHLYNYDKTYYSACFVYPFCVYEDWNCDIFFDNIRKIWQDKNITVITGEKVFKKIKYNVFDNAKKINYIYGPMSQAYSKYQELKKELLQSPKDNILCFALGPCGKLLAYDAYKLGYRVLDLGHLIKNYDLYRKSINMSEKELREALLNFTKPN